jgi:hypothetical protein
LRWQCPRTDFIREAAAPFADGFILPTRFDDPYGLASRNLSRGSPRSAAGAPHMEPARATVVLEAVAPSRSSVALARAAAVL